MQAVHIGLGDLAPLASESGRHSGPKVVPLVGDRQGIGWETGQSLDEKVIISQSCGPIEAFGALRMTSQAHNSSISLSLL